MEFKVSPFIAKEIKVDPKTPELPLIDGNKKVYRYKRFS